MKYSKLYSSYGDFNSEIYFGEKYQKFASKLEVTLAVQTHRENAEKVVEILQKVFPCLLVLHKSWYVSKIKQAKEKEDFVNEYSFYCEEKPLYIEIDLHENMLSLKFLYDTQDEALEKEVLACYRALRKEFGKQTQPVFRVLSMSHGSYHTEDFDLEGKEVDVAQLYNDDFQEVDETIRESMQKEQSGLILLHGTPGTGKTSYIKHLVKTYPEVEFIFIPNDFVSELLKPGFVSFLVRHKQAVLIIEDAEKVILSRENEGRDSVVSTILQLTDGLFSQYLNIKVICTFNTDVSKIDQALLRKGRMIAFYEFKPLSVEKTNALLEESNIESPNKALTLAEIFHYKQKGFETNSENKIGF